MLTTPPIAVQQIKREILSMADTATENFRLSCDIACTLDYGKIETFRANEKQLDFINKELSRFIAELLQADLNEKDRLYLTTAFRTLTDLERVGDYAENIIEYADKLKEANETFSDDAKREITLLQETICSLADKVITAYRDHDFNALREAYEIEDGVDGMTADMAQRHIKRLSEGLCTPDVGTQYLSLSTNAERVADHYINVGKTIKSYARRSRQK